VLFLLSCARSWKIGYSFLVWHKDPSHFSRDDLAAVYTAHVDNIQTGMFTIANVVFYICTHARDWLLFSGGLKVLPLLDVTGKQTEGGLVVRAEITGSFQPRV
jgi:hypothetical protein